jgi:hypothetical protein
LARAPTDPFARVGTLTESAGFEQVAYARTLVQEHWLGRNAFYGFQQQQQRQVAVTRGMSARRCHDVFDTDFRPREIVSSELHVDIRRIDVLAHELAELVPLDDAVVSRQD